MSGESNIRRKVTVVGGFYAEVCYFPKTNVEFYGSGGRGAAAMPKGDAEVELVTFADKTLIPALGALAEASDFTFKTQEIESIFKFEYRHPLSKPVFYSPRKIPEVPLRVEGDIVLCYGMMEGQPVVTAKTAVFDPQSHDAAKPFSFNGSTAERLAIIANHSEAEYLTGEKDWEVAASKLLAAQGAAVVVVKCGPRGAIVATAEKVSIVPAFKTRRVFKVGSGDVFSSMFTYAWAVRGMDPHVAARHASLSTAYYCNFTSLPIPWPLPEEFQPPEAVISTEKKTAYLAGPFFAPQELGMIEECRRLLGDFGVKVFSPFHDVGIDTPEKVAPADLKGLEESDFVFAILDHFDAGTLFEIGYAVAMKIPVIAVYHGRDECSLTMLRGTKCLIYQDLASAIYAASSM